MEDAALVFSGVKEAFRMRHIFAHELTPEYDVPRHEVERAFRAASQFLHASDEFIGHLLNPNEPITQGEMTQDAARKTSEEEVLRSLPASKRRTFQTAQRRWADARERVARLRADLIAEGGSMWPMIYYGTMKDITANRVNEVRLLLSL